jgi:hypothetical protein
MFTLMGMLMKKLGSKTNSQKKVWVYKVNWVCFKVCMLVLLAGYPTFKKPNNLTFN